MKFDAEKTDLLDCLQKTHPIVASKSTLSVLANVLIETEEAKVIFTTTNLQVGIRCETAATIIEGGASTLPARMLFGIVRELPPSRVSVEINDDNVASISCGSSFFKVLGISREEFPRVANFQGEPLFSLPQSILSAMLQKTAFAVSREDPRHFLTGLYFSIRNKRLTLVGTDGRRLSRIACQVALPEDYSGSLIVPIKAVEELIKMLRPDGDVLVFVAGNQIGFRVAADLLVSLLIDAKFPDYEGIIPKSSAAKAVLDREEFAAMVRQASLLTSEQSSSVRLRFEADQLLITANTPELGEARVSMPVKYEGKAMAIGFNPGCIRDVLNCMDEEEITLELTDSVSPGVIRGKGEFLHLIMPMRLPETES